MAQQHRPQRTRPRTEPTGEDSTFPEVLRSLVWNLLLDKKTRTRFAALRQLSDFGTEARPALPDIINALADPEENIRRMAFEALCELCPTVDEHSDRLMEMFQGGSREFHLQEAQKLLTLPEVLEALSTRSPEWPALHVLIKRGREEETGPLPAHSPNASPGTGSEVASITEDAMRQTTSSSTPSPSAVPESLQPSDPKDQHSTQDSRKSDAPESDDLIAKVMRENPERYIAWNRMTKTIIAIHDSFDELMKRVPDPEDPNLVVEASPYIHPDALARPFELFPDESPDILDDVRDIWQDAADLWLDTPNPLLQGRRPRELIKTKDEHLVRGLIRNLVFGTPA